MAAEPLADDWEAHWSDFEDASDANPAQQYRRLLVGRSLEGLIHAKGPRIIDFGAGTGALLHHLHVRVPTAELRGLEYSAAGVAIASERVPAASMMQCDLVELPTVPQGWDSWADAGTCSEVLEHLDDPYAFLVNVRRFLRPGALFIVTVPAGPRSAFDIHIGHRRHYTTDSLRTLLTGAGFDVDEVCRAGFPFFNLYRLAVMARGRRLVEDARTGRAADSPPARAIAATFRLLFRLNAPRSPWGWQLVAVAREPNRS